MGQGIKCYRWRDWSTEKRTTLPWSQIWVWNVNSSHLFLIQCHCCHTMQFLRHSTEICWKNVCAWWQRGEEAGRRGKTGKWGHLSFWSWVFGPKTQYNRKLLTRCQESDEVLKAEGGTSLVAQWLRIHLPMQGTQVRALVREDPTCRGATKPVRHDCWVCALEPTCHNYWSPCA